MHSTVCGSSPLARGLPRPASRSATRPRIIPARAGFTAIRLPNLIMTKDHPRSRGVYLKQIARDVEKTGSSPLARGLRGHRQAAVSLLGIIPARAGFTGDYNNQYCELRDHPRSRGFYCRRWSPSPMPRGSSPLARGLRRPRPGRWCQPRIIPARAGFTPAMRGAIRYSGDHPRSRGVYDEMPATNHTANGSSPLARGLLGEFYGNVGEERIIPARAGFTNAGALALASQADHPRSRGVYLGWVVVEE